MSRTRIALLALLFLAPWVFLIGVGSYALWEYGWWVYVSWPMFISVALAYFLAWRWTRRSEMPPVDVPPPNYWTERDKEAWDKVQANAASYESVTTDQLVDPKHYTELALDLATQVARSYDPRVETAGDAFDQLTLPEILACVELAANDLNDMVQRYVPGSHLLRVVDARRAKKATEWYKRGQNAYWLASAVLNPLQAIPRYIASRSALGGLFDRIQNNIILWFHTAFIHQLGHYLIELNSGRLKVGVKRYRELISMHQEPLKEDGTRAATESPATTPGGDGTATVGSDSPALPSAPAVQPVAIAILGSVKSGKSSVVNGLLGKSVASVNTLPVMHMGVTHDLTLAGGQPVRLLDTTGYGQHGPNDAEFRAAVEAAQSADLLLLVTAANNPGRQPDVDLLDRLKAWFADRPQLKLPPIVVVVNQVDLLSPKNEWSPPYSWKSGTKPKEVNIRDCVAHVAEQFGQRVTSVVPVAVPPEQPSFGIQDCLVPAIVAQLHDARGAAILKAFESETGSGQIGKLGQQILDGGRKVFELLWGTPKK